MKSFFKDIFVFLLPLLVVFVVLITVYFTFDPFKVLYSYDPCESFTMNMNRDYVSTETFLAYNDIEHYDSFIFGSSRAIGYNPNAWIEYIGQKTKPFSYDAASENIYGIYYKIKFLDKLGVSLSNSLILVDVTVDFFTQQKERDYLSKTHPMLLGNTLCSRLGFQYSHLRAYLSLRFLISYYGYDFFRFDNKFTERHRLKSSMRIEYPTNGLVADDFNVFLKNNPSYYKNKEIFYKRPDQEYVYDELITEDVKAMLVEIKQTLNKHHTNFKVVINPMYDQRKLCSADLEILTTVFGKDSVFDFSGKNQITKSKYNYYENNHFKPSVGDSIMAIIYKRNTYSLADATF